MTITTGGGGTNIEMRAMLTGSFGIETDLIDDLRCELAEVYMYFKLARGNRLFTRVLGELVVYCSTAVALGTIEVGALT
jgi:hypothetical protein